MELQTARTDASILSDGAWVDSIPGMDDLRLKVRPLNSDKFRRLQTRLIGQVPRGKRIGGKVDPEEIDRIEGICLLNAVLLDWGNLKSKGEDVPYSMEAAKPLLFEPEWRDFRDAVVWAATVVSGQREEDAADDEKN